MEEQQAHHNILINPIKATDICNGLIDATVNRITMSALDLIQRDPHQWSTRSCPTCEAISALVQRSFGCVLYTEQKRRQG